MSEYIYTDLSPDLDITWDKDINITMDSRAVKNSIKGIIGTKIGSRPFFPEFGSDVGALLFENATPLILSTIKSSIVTAIRNFEPRVDDLAVRVTADYDGNGVHAEIRFSIIDNPEKAEELKLHLQK